MLEFLALIQIYNKIITSYFHFLDWHMGGADGDCLQPCNQMPFHINPIYHQMP